MDIILFAIPFFVILIILEITVDRIRNTGFYRINDSISSMNAGILSRINVIFRKLIPLAIYVYVENNYALLNLQESSGQWIFAFIFYDFCYYWNHRFGHEINVLWASHVVHHSSEEYNLTTALRQTSSGILGWIFYLPMALAGIDPLVMISVAALNLVYQFWVHTRHVGKLGWYEWLFVTPSTHRVHHAINEDYIDKNYGGVFIIWDKIFNTFQEEVDEKPCVYGIRKPLNSWDPIWTNVHYYAQLARDAWHTKNWRDKLLIWFKPTGWRPADVEKKFPLEKFELKHFKKFDVCIPAYNSWYSLMQHLLIIVFIFLFLQNANNMDTTWQLLNGGFIVLSCFSIGNILAGKNRAVLLEYFRYGILIYFAFIQSVPQTVLFILVATALLGMLMCFFIKTGDESVVEKSRS